MTDMEPEYREWLIDFGDSGYVAMYRLAGDRVVILAVRHQRELGY
jgi:plasmid stabilization system protein ParE